MQSAIVFPPCVTKTFRACALAALACWLVSCDTQRKAALRELAAAGIEPSGRSLLQAVSEGRTRHVDWLVKAGVHTEHSDPLGRSPLRVAIENGDVASAFLLLDAEANVNATTPDGVSLLGMAVERGETAIIGRLLEAGARTDGIMPDGEKILPWAIREGRLAFVREMMRAGADPHLKDIHENPLLHVAIESGRRDVVETLIELGADPGALDGKGESTLNLALRRGWNDVAPRLIAAGADPNLPSPEGISPLGRAIAAGDVELAAVLLKHGANPNYVHPGHAGGSAFSAAFASGDRRMLRLFLDGTIRPPKESLDAWLWQAFVGGDAELGGLLIRHGASPHARGADGRRLAEAAILEKNGTFVKLLLDHRAIGARELHLACAAGDPQIVKLLLVSGIRADATIFPSLDSLLGAALRAGNDRIAAMLVDFGAATDLRLPEGQSAFHFAIARGCGATVKAFLASGADPNALLATPVGADFMRHVPSASMRWALRADRNITPLMLAAASGNTATARHLLAAGAKLNAWTRINRMWPINFASERGDVKMMKTLLGQDPHKEERYIVVHLSEQRARMYDGQGNEIFNTRVSTGRRGYATRTGEFVITNKHRNWTSTIYHSSMPYFQRLSCSDFGLHQGNVPGYPASHGCIRVPAGNAAKLFSMTQTGDRVKIVP